MDLELRVLMSAGICERGKTFFPTSVLAEFCSELCFHTRKYDDRSAVFCRSASRALKFQFISFTNQVSAQLRLEGEAANHTAAGSAPSESVSMKWASFTLQLPV